MTDVLTVVMAIVVMAMVCAALWAVVVFMVVPIGMLYDRWVTYCWRRWGQKNG
jgi:hypothetical protein